MRQSQAAQGRRNGLVLRALRLEELAARRRVVEQILDLDGGARRMGARSAAGLDATCHFDAPSAILASHPAGQRQPRHRGGAGQGFATKPEAGNAFQIAGGADLAGGVAADRQRQVARMNAVPVIGHANPLHAPLLDAHLNAPGARVQAVFHQFLDDGGGAFDHLAGGDLIGHRRRQLSDAAGHRCASKVPGGGLACQ